MNSGRGTSVIEGLGEPEQDANTALIELDKGLRSSHVGEQCEAIVRFPRLFEKYPFPILINSSFLKLADVFRVGTNFLRLWVLRVCQQSEKHLDKILNVDEFVRRVFSVIHSNDPVARALSLRTLGSVACIIPERLQVHHSIRRSLDSHDAVEVEAAIEAAMQFAKQSKSFAIGMCEKISDMIQGLSTPAHMKLQLIPILQYMHHDTVTAAMVRRVCTELVPKYPAKEFVITTLHTLTKLAAATLVDIPSQVELLMKCLNEETRLPVKVECLVCLKELASAGAHLWPSECVSSVVAVARTSRHQSIVALTLDLLMILTKSPIICHEYISPKSDLIELCKETCYSHDVALAGKSIIVMTNVLTVCPEGHSREEIDKHNESIEILLLSLIVMTIDFKKVAPPPLEFYKKLVAKPALFKKLVKILKEREILEDYTENVEELEQFAAATDDPNNFTPPVSERLPLKDIIIIMKSLLKCIVSMVKVHRSRSEKLIQIVALQMQDSDGEIRFVLAQALAGIASNLEPGVLYNYLKHIFNTMHAVIKEKSVEEMDVDHDPGSRRQSSASGESSEESSTFSTEVVLCTLILQTLGPEKLTGKKSETLQSLIKLLDFWPRYRVARTAARYGHFGISAEILSGLKEHVSSEHLYFWLEGLCRMCLGEFHLLQIIKDGKVVTPLVERLWKAGAEYEAAVAALKAAASGPGGAAGSHQFQWQYAGLRCEMLQRLAALASACTSLCLSPPPAIAVALVHATRDEHQRSGHITNQLRKCAKELRACGEMYWKLYQSAFDADPGTLHNIQILQHICLLLAYSVESVSLDNHQGDEPSLSFAGADYDFFWDPYKVEGESSDEEDVASGQADLGTSPGLILPNPEHTIDPEEAAENNIEYTSSESDGESEYVYPVDVAGPSSAPDPPPKRAKIKKPKKIIQLPLETRLLIDTCQAAAQLGKYVDRSSKVVTHHHVRLILDQIDILVSNPICFPRYLFQVVQSTTVTLAVSPQPKVEWVTLTAGCQLAVKVEGVIQRSLRGAKPFRTVDKVIVSLSTHCAPRTPAHPAEKPPTASEGPTSVMTQTVKPHKDFFAAQFLVSLGPGSAQATVTVSAAVIDQDGVAWQTGPRSSLTVKQHDDPTNRTA